MQDFQAKNAKKPLYRDPFDRRPDRSLLRMDGKVDKKTLDLIERGAGGKTDQARGDGPQEQHQDERASASGAEQMSRLLSVSRNSKRPKGGCYAAVKRYIIKAGGYGNIINPYTDNRLAKYQHYAHDFADAMHALGPATFGLQEISVSTPFEAPAGALVVVKPDSPGTGDPTAGDIAVASGGGNFYNDGVMHYRGPKAWPPKAGGMLGCFMPK